MRLLDRINRTGTTVVMATHDQRIVDAMRRRVIELDHGIARARPGARRLRRRAPEDSMSRLAYFARETLISLRRNLLMTIAGIMTVAISLFLFGGILLVSRTVDHGTQQVEARRRARDLHAGRRRATARSTRSRTQLEADPQREELPLPRPRRRVRRVQEARSPTSPRCVENDDARRPARRRSASCRQTPQLTDDGRRRRSRTCPASSRSTRPPSR